MIQFAADFFLRLEAGEQGRVRLRGSMGYFDGHDPAVVLQIGGLVNGGHTAVANHVRDGKAIVEQAAWGKLAPGVFTPVGRAGGRLHELRTELHAIRMQCKRPPEQSKLMGCMLKFH